jgi:hypothetical protein
MILKRCLPCYTLTIWQCYVIKFDRPIIFSNKQQIKKNPSVLRVEYKEYPTCRTRECKTVQMRITS